MAALTEAEKEKCRYHLGYMASSFAASMFAGQPRPIQTIFLLESAMSLLTNANAVDRVRCILQTLEDYEGKLKAAGCSLQAAEVGDIKLRGAKAGETYPDLLEREYVRWAQRLADVFGVPLYPFSARFSGNGSGQAGSVPVRGG